MRGGSPKRRLVLGQAVAFTRGRLAARPLRHQQELAIVGHEHLAVLRQVLRDLLARSELIQVCGDALDLDGPAARQLAGQRLQIDAFLELVRREQPAIRQPRALVVQVDHAAHLRLERTADRVQQRRQRAVTGRLQARLRPMRGSYRARGGRIREDARWTSKRRISACLPPRRGCGIIAYHDSKDVPSQGSVSMSVEIPDVAVAARRRPKPTGSWGCWAPNNRLGAGLHLLSQRVSTPGRRALCRCRIAAAPHK